MCVCIYIYLFPLPSPLFLPPSPPLDREKDRIVSRGCVARKKKKKKNIRIIYSNEGRDSKEPILLYFASLPDTRFAFFLSFFFSFIIYFPRDTRVGSAREWLRERALRSCHSTTIGSCRNAVEYSRLSFVFAIVVSLKLAGRVASSK